jgi:hypothetical protein
VLDLLAATAVLLLIVVLVVLAGLVLTVVPFVLAADLAEQRGRSTARAGLLAVAGIGLGLLGALLVRRTDLPGSLAVLPLLLCFAGPASQVVGGAGGDRVRGRAGSHERA